MIARQLTNDHHDRLATLFTFAAGAIQALLAFSILFLPVFARCMGQPDGSLDCTRMSYIQQGGNIVGYAFLGLFLGLGIAAVISPHILDARRVCLIRWLIVVVSAIFAVIGGWSIGLMFLPGGLLMVLPALSCRRQKDRRLA